MPKTTQSLLYAAQVAAGLNTRNRIEDARQGSAEPQYARIIVETDGTNVTGDVITLIELPAGAIVMPELSKIVVETDLTSGVLTLDVGDVVNRVRYCNGANCSNVGAVEFLAPAIPVGFLTRTKVVKDPVVALNTSLVSVRVASLTATATAGRFVVILAYATI